MQVPPGALRRHADRGQRDDRAGLGLRRLCTADSCRADGDGWRLNGTKIFVTNGPVADLALVFAMTDPRRVFTAASLPSWWMPTPRVIARASSSRRSVCELLRSESCSSKTCPSPDGVLGGEGGGAQVFVRAMEWERSCLFASHVGTMERLLEKAIEYARTRKQQGQTISKFQAVSHKISDMKIQLEAARLLTYKSAWNLERSRRVSLDAAISKTFVSESLVRSALDTIQVFGGYGFLAEYEIERTLRDSVGSTLYSGTSEIQRNIIAGWLGL